MSIYTSYIKKRSHIVVKGLITVVVLVIVMNQIVWLSNMYNLFQREFSTNVNEAVDEAVWMELSERSEKMGGFSVYSHNLSNPNDTSTFFTKNVVMEDSTYTFTINKNDPKAMYKIMQFALKKYVLVDLNNLSSIFKRRLTFKYGLRNAYFDYIDLEKDTLISTNRPEDFVMADYVSTDTVPLDIINTIGVVGYVDRPHKAILDSMKRQLILSVILILIGIVSLFFIARSFIFQWKSEKMRQDSVNAMTHEFKRPISSAVAMASVIPYYLEKNDVNRVSGFVDDILIALNKLTYYTKRIQQISNNESGSVVLDKVNVDIVPFFESLQRRYTSQSNAVNEKVPEVIVNLECNISKEVMVVDLLHFSNVMDNLVENAIKYTVRPTAVIDISVTEIGDRGLRISVKDNGIGISRSDQKYIFDKYYRIKREETKGRLGFGLGLTYVKSIIDAHEGDITVNSKLNEGSEFVITLKD